MTVGDAEFKVVKELSLGEIAAFNRQWNEKADAKIALASESGVHFKLDVAQETGNNRWLSYTRGLVTRLDQEAHPVYRVANPAEFNQLIRAKR